MNFPRKTALRAGLTLALLAASGLAAAATTAFTATYKGGSTSACNSSYNMSGQEPSTSGKYPVMVYIGGTGESYTSNWASAAVSAAAAKGFVAASVQYDNSSFGTCATIGQRGKCIFDPTNVNSAIAKLCSRAKADCSKGVVTMGLSQGSVISVLSRNNDPRIQASLGQGAGTTYTAAYNLSSCMAAGGHTQANDRVRIVNGIRDMFVGGTAATARVSGETVTGLSCGSSAQSCYRANGSGWHVVQNLDVLDGYADHCFMGYGGNDYLAQCSGALVDANYQNGTAAWALPASITWLKSFVTP